MTFTFERWNILDDCDPVDHVQDAEGEYVRAEDAINREAVNAAEITTLKAQLKEARLSANRLDAHNRRKNELLRKLRKMVQDEFDFKEH